MKVLIIILRDLKSFVTSELRVFFIFAIGIIIATISFLVLFSFCLSSRDSYYKEFGFKTKSYGIKFNENVDIKKQHQMINTLISEDVFPEIDEISVSSQIKLPNKDLVSLVGYDALKRDLFYCTEGRKFTKDELNNGLNVIIPWVGYFDYTQKTSYLDQDYNLNGKLYKIVGVADYPYKNTLFIPLTTYLKNKYNISFLSIVFSKRLDSKQQLEFQSFVHDTYRSVSISLPPKIDVSQEKQFIQKLIIYVCLLIFALINIISLYSFWIYKNVSQFLIFKLCGAGNYRLYIIIMLETFITSTLFMLFGYLIYVLFIPVSKEFSSYYYLKFYHILFAYLLIISLILLIINKTAIKIVNATSVYKVK